jgi:hypothetical protein
VNKETLKRRGGTQMTTTVYRPKKREKPTTTPAASTDEIYICVLRITPGQSDAIAVEIVKATSGTRTGARVQSPNGGIYAGSKIQNTKITVYVLEKQSSDVLILIYAPTPSTQAAVARLAANIGNGGGLNDYPETKTTVWALPQKPPSDLVLISFTTKTRAEMDWSSDLKSSGNDAETQKMIDYFSQFIPERATHAVYRDGARRDWEVMIYDYESTRRAWNTWFFLSWTIGLSGNSIRTKHGGGIYADTDEGRALMFQKGPYMIFVLAPNGTQTDKLISFGDGFQV